MANGTYGTKKPALITSADIDVFYYYMPTRSSESADFSAFKKLDSSVLSTMNVEVDNDNTILPGMYNLNLPLDKFSKTGIYTIYIKPKEVSATILDVSTLASNSSVRGIVIDASSSLNDEMYNNGNLTGYRVEYFTDNKRDEEYRIITSNFKCEPVAQNLNDASQKGIRYRLNDSSNLVFCTLTPSTAMSFKSDSLPYIGKVGQRIALINTKFNPVSIEMEITEHDIESVSAMLEGPQIRNLSNGIITTFDKEGGIYHQADYGNITNPAENINHDFKIPRTENIVSDEIHNLEKIEENI